MITIPTGQRRKQSYPEELANSISHGAALLAALIATPFLISRTVQNGDGGLIVGSIVFCATIIFLYLTSTLYHAWPIGRIKRIFRVIEHAAIFLLIAGTYTPFTLGVLSGVWGWALFGIAWSLALAGVMMKVYFKTSHPIISTSLYLFMGWIIVIAAKPLLANMPIEGFLWLLAGGLSYTVGVIFFATDSKLYYGHFIWHLFVIAGTACHFIAVFRYAGW